MIGSFIKLFLSINWIPFRVRRLGVENDWFGHTLTESVNKNNTEITTTNREPNKWDRSGRVSSCIINVREDSLNWLAGQQSIQVDLYQTWHGEIRGIRWAEEILLWHDALCLKQGGGVWFYNSYYSAHLKKIGL